MPLLPEFWVRPLDAGDSGGTPVLIDRRIPGARPLGHKLIKGIDRDRGTPRGATPPTPPGIRVRTTAVRSGSLSSNIESGKTEAVEIRVAQSLLDRRMS